MSSEVNAATRAPTKAAISAVSDATAALSYPSVDPSVRNEALYVFPPTFGQGEACWVPASSAVEAKNVIENVAIDEILVTQRRSVPIAYEAVKDLSAAREQYLASIETVRHNWESAGKVMTPAIAESVSETRFVLKRQVRAQYPLSGFMAKAYDVIRHGGTDKYEARIRAWRQEMIQRNDLKPILDKAVSETDALANRLGALSKVSRPVMKALSIGGNVAIAIEIPYRVYQLDVATTDDERAEALEHLTAAATVGSFAAVCIVLGVGTGGFGFLACGLAPAVGGIFAGAAAKAIYRNIR